MIRFAALPDLLYPVLFSLFFSGSSETLGQVLQKPYDNSLFVNIDSVTVHYRVWNGDRQDVKGNVLLIHGFCGSTFCWRENIDTLAKANYRVVAVDVPGYGYSSRNLHNQSHSNRARILWDLVRAINPADTTRWNIVGHSMGGGIAEAMALMEPARTKSLTLVDGMVFLKNQDMKGAFITSARMKGINELYISIFENNIISERPIRRLLRNVYGYVPDSSVIAGYLGPLLLPGTSESVIDMFAFSREIVVLHADGLKQIPVKVIWGKKDRTIRLSTGKKLKRAVPSVQLEVIPKAYHSPMETHPSEFNAILLNFLDCNNQH